MQHTMQHTMQCIASCVHHATHHATHAVHPPCIRHHAPRAYRAGGRHGHDHHGGRRELRGAPKPDPNPDPNPHPHPNPDPNPNQVHDVKKFGAYVLHVGVVTQGTLKVGDEATLTLTLTFTRTLTLT